MEYYPELLVPPEHLMPEYAAEYAQQYMVPNHEGEYTIRSSVLVDGGDRFGVSAVEFDKFEELVWMGNQGGHITSYYGPTLQKYTSFQVHETEEVRDIKTVEQGLYILTTSTLRHQIRRGIPKHTFRSENMIDMQCLFQVSATNFLMGGHQDKLLDLDLNKMVESVIPIQEEGCAVLRSGGGALVACGSAGGVVALRDLRSPRVAEHTFRAHSACLSDLDMQGDLLISCGFQSVSDVAVAEPYVVVWDVRRLRGRGRGRGGGAAAEAAWSVPVASPPLLLHFLPAFSGRAAAVAGDGHVALMHVNAAHDEQSVFQMDVNGSQCSVMDVAATSQALLFGDQSGHLHLFSPQHNHEPVFNNFSRASEFADPVEGVPFVSISDASFQFSSVPLPALATGARWFNQLPAEFFNKVYRKPWPVDPEVLKTMKMQGPIGYAPNPRTRRRNQMPYVEDTLEDLNAQKQYENKYVTQPVPKHYQKMDIRYNKHSPNEVDMESINKTGFPGLEGTIPNSYCNSMLQVLYHTPAVKATLLSHTCAKEFCLSCELGFLFRMLDTSGGAACGAGNFLRAFRTVPEAAALGLIQPDRGPDARQDYVGLIQSWNRFILHQIHYEILETRKKERELLSNSSPPKPGPPAPQKCRMSAHLVNGQFAHLQEYQFTEMEYLPPTQFNGHAEFDGRGEDGWNHTNSVSEDGSAELGSNVPVNNHELNNSQPAEKEETEIMQLFAIGRHQLNRCLKCNKEEERESVALACALHYPAAGGGGGGEQQAPQRGFAELVRASLAARRSTPAWCDHCHRFTPTTQRGRLIRLPPILAINCGGVTAHEKAYWAKGSQKDSSEAGRRGGKPCRYGLQCARPGCRFKHPDRPSPTPGSSRSPAHEAHCVLPHQLLVRLQPDGDVIINNKPEQSPTDSPKSERNKNGRPSGSQELEYSLSACVVCVEDNPPNLVAYIRTDPASDHWHLFNDLTIVPVSLEEVVQFGAWWKSPCVLFYCTSGARPPDPPPAPSAPSAPHE